MIIKMYFLTTLQFNYRSNRRLLKICKYSTYIQYRCCVNYLHFGRSLKLLLFLIIIGYENIFFYYVINLMEIILRIYLSCTMGIVKIELLT